MGSRAHTNVTITYTPTDTIYEEIVVEGWQASRNMEKLAPGDDPFDPVFIERLVREAVERTIAKLHTQLRDHIWTEPTWAADHASAEALALVIQQQKERGT